MQSFSECNSRSVFASRDRAITGGGSRKRLQLTFLLVWSGSTLAQQPIILSSAKTFAAGVRCKSARKLTLGPIEYHCNSFKKELKCGSISE